MWDRASSRAKPHNDTFSAEQPQIFAVTLATVWKRLCFLPWRDHLSCFEAPRLRAGTYRLKFVLIAMGVTTSLADNSTMNESMGLSPPGPSKVRQMSLLRAQQSIGSPVIYLSL